MRSATLCAVIGLTGCAKPVAVEGDPVGVAPVAVAPVAVPAPETAPMPRAIPDDPRWRARQESHRNDKDPVLRGLARRDINAGDPVEPLIKLHPQYEVVRGGNFVIMTLSTGYGGTQLVAKNGKLVLGRTSSCIYCDEFFKDMTEKDWTTCWDAYSAALRKRHGLKDLPAPALDNGIPPREVVNPTP